MQNSSGRRNREHSLIETSINQSLVGHKRCYNVSANILLLFIAVQSLSLVWLCDPTDCRTPGSYVLYCLLDLFRFMSIELVMLSNHFISAFPFSFCFNLSQHQGLFQLVNSLDQRAKYVLELQLQHQSFQWIFRVDFLQDWLVWSPCSPRDSQESSPTPQFKSISSSALHFLYGPTLTSIHDYWKKT